MEKKNRLKLATLRPFMQKIVGLILSHFQTKGLKVILVLILFGLAGCAGTPPIDDYNLAYTSIESAKATQASRFAPGLYNQAEDYYRQALIDYEDGSYSSAKNNFVLCRQFAEKAENFSVLKKAESGE